MKYLLDTNICIYLIRRQRPSVIARFRECAPGEVAVSSVTVAELVFGVEKSGFPERNRGALQEFLLPLEVVSFDAAAAAAYGVIRADLERRGEPIGPMDLLIAAQAAGMGVTLVTNNAREFRKVRGLRVENWA